MTNAAVPTPPRPSTHGAKGRQCPDDLWKLGERAVTRAHRWADESAHEPTPQSAKLLSRILADPDGLTFTTRFVDDVVRPVDLDVASAALQKLARGRKDFLPPALAAAMGLGSSASRLAPRSVTAIARRVFREIVGDLVVDATDKGLGPALARLRKGGNRLNVNLLGEAVLGEKEAARRLADREREETLSFLSHDLRSPQATILAIIEKLRTTTDGAERSAGLDELARQSRRALELTDGFLAYTRAEIKPIQPEEHDLNDLLTEVIDLAWFSANAKKVRLTFNPVDAAILRCDADLLRRAFSNLVENGIRHSPIDSSIEVTLINQAPHFRITIRDHGPGVPPDKQAFIFKPFWQSAGSETSGKKSSQGSAGLGLAMVHKAIARHGGTIRVLNHPTGGACFEICLPQGMQDV